MLDRRAMIAGSGALLAAGPLSARVLPQDMVPLIGPGYRPADVDERGMWQQMERVEEEIAGSNLLIRDPVAVRYLHGLIGDVGGPAAKDMRIYLAHIPDFNAVMFPTGFAVVFSGLLLRMRNEAQLAGVIAHESGHFLRKHQLRAWRDTKRKSSIFAVLAMGAGVAGGAAGMYTGNLTQLGQFGTILSLLQYSRAMEAEADAIGIRLIAEAGYDPMWMPRTWQQLIAELNLSARFRRKHRERDFSLFGTHPSPESRIADLTSSAREVTIAGKAYRDGREPYLAAIAAIRPTLLDDQVKLNDPGASHHVIGQLALDGWNGLLAFNQGEVWRLRGASGDDARAADDYARAVLYPDAPADAWRWHGLMLVKSGRRDEGRAALARYLAMAPTAPDAPFVRQLLDRGQIPNGKT